MMMMEHDVHENIKVGFNPTTETPRHAERALKFAALKQPSGSVHKCVHTYTLIIYGYIGQLIYTQMATYVNLLELLTLSLTIIPYTVLNQCCCLDVHDIICHIGGVEIRDYRQHIAEMQDLIYKRMLLMSSKKIKTAASLHTIALRVEVFFFFLLFHTILWYKTIQRHDNVAKASQYQSVCEAFCPTFGLTYGLYTPTTMDRQS